MEKMKLILIVLIGIVISGCAAVNSSELETTAAEDLRIEATVTEKNSSDMAYAVARMKTAESEVSITLDQGETLTLAADTDDGISADIVLGRNWLSELFKEYEAYIIKIPAEDSYYITYTDSEGMATTAGIINGEVSEILSPSNNHLVNGDSITVTWDSSFGVTGRLYISVEWDKVGTNETRTYELENSGSYELEIPADVQSAKMKLIHKQIFDTAPGFAESYIVMENISTIVNLRFSN